VVIIKRVLIEPAEELSAEAGPVYLREGEAAPQGVGPERVVTIKPVLIEPAEQAAEELPEPAEPSPPIERPSPSFKRPLATPPLGIV
jgi:hypothetical protein